MQWIILLSDQTPKTNIENKRIWLSCTGIPRKTMPLITALFCTLEKKYFL